MGLIQGCSKWFGCSDFSPEPGRGWGNIFGGQMCFRHWNGIGMTYIFNVFLNYYLEHFIRTHGSYVWQQFVSVHHHEEWIFFRHEEDQGLKQSLLYGDHSQIITRAEVFFFTLVRKMWASHPRMGKMRALLLHPNHKQSKQDQGGRLNIYPCG